MLKTSLIITGDASVAKKEVADLGAALGKVGTDARAAAPGVAQLDKAIETTAGHAREAASAQAILTRASNENFRSLGQQKAGMFQLGQNLQDVGVQMSMGTDLMRIMAMQGGQLATAVDLIGVKGAGGRLAAFLAGPYGAVVLTATAILGPWAAKLFEVSDGQDKVAKGGLALVDALGKQRYATDAAREAIAAYNQQQEKARKETELATRQSLAKADADLREASSTREKTKAELERLQARSYDPNLANGGTSGASGNLLNNTRAAAIADSLKAQNDAIAELEKLRRNLLIKVGTANGEAAADPLKAIDLKYNLQRQQAEEAAQSNDRLARSIDQTVAAIERRRAAEKKVEEDRQRRDNAKPRTVSLGNQIEAGSAAAILTSAERYRGLSENRAGDRDQLRDLFKQANVSIDPAMVAWCAAFVNSVLATNGIKGTGSLSARSFLGFGQSTDTPNKGDIVVSKRGSDPAQGHVGFYQGTDAKGRVLVLGGNTGNAVGTQAVARSDVLGFRRAPSAADSYVTAQKAAADAAKEQQRDLDQIIAKYLPLTQAAKEYAAELARIDELAKSYDGKNPTSGLTAEQANTARAALKAANDKRLAEINLTPEVKAADDAKKSLDGVVQSLGAELAARQSLDPVQQAMARHQDELAKLSDAEREAYQKKLSTLYAQDEAYRAAEEATRAAADAQRQFREMALDAFDAIALGGENAGKVIDRLAQRIASAAIEAAVLGTGPLAALLKGGGNIAPATGGAPAAAVVPGIGTGQAAADILGKSVGKSVGDRLDGLLGKGQSGKLLQNAGFGYAAASIVGGSGIAGGLGGAIGGQIAGKLLSSTLGAFAGPLGSIAGGLLGGVVGKLFTSVKSGSATIGSANGQSVVTGSTGDAAYKKASEGLASAVGDSVDAIVAKLGGTLGSYAVSIGKKGDKYVVDNSGRGSTKYGKANDGITAYATAEEAQAAALANAIADGAVQGLSPKVAAAFRSTTNIDKALSEALKVQDLELTMGGITGTIDKAFRDLDTQAKERVRLATQYGFDLVAIEKKNGEDRAKLAEQLQKQQVGSLQKLIDEMTQGSLFEGTALDKLAALDNAIGKARTDLANNVEGAGDTLADLLQRKAATSKEAYGTTGAYAADRTAILDEARAAVAASNARIAAAQAANSSDPALKITNATLDEIAEQNAKVVSTLGQTNLLLSQIAAGGGGGSLSGLNRAAAY